MGKEIHGSDIRSSTPCSIIDLLYEREGLFPFKLDWFPFRALPATYFLPSQSALIISDAFSPIII
jgi:hypothetical protein